VILLGKEVYLVGMLGFLKKREKETLPSQQEEKELEMPPLPPDIKSDSYADIPSFPDRGEEPDFKLDTLEVPSELGDVETSKQETEGVPSLPEGAEEDEQLPPPPELKSMMQEPAQDDALPPMQPARPAVARPQLSSTAPSTIFVRAHRFRDILDDVAAVQASCREVQGDTHMKEIREDQEAGHDAFHEAVEGAQRKLLLADKMLFEG
jgi:hypothetical protein